MRTIDLNLWINRLENFLTWLTETNGYVKGVPAPNWLNLLGSIFIVLVFCTEIVKYIKGKKNKRNNKKPKDEV
jgi:hypothetical protein